MLYYTDAQVVGTPKFLDKLIKRWIAEHKSWINFPLTWAVLQKVPQSNESYLWSAVITVHNFQTLITLKPNGDTLNILAAITLQVLIGKAESEIIGHMHRFLQLMSIRFQFIWTVFLNNHESIQESFPDLGNKPWYGIWEIGPYTER